LIGNIYKIQTPITPIVHRKMILPITTATAIGTPANPAKDVAPTELFFGGRRVSTKMPDLRALSLQKISSSDFFPGCVAATIANMLDA
jgi:hypothetical protein